MSRLAHEIAPFDIEWQYVLTIVAGKRDGSQAVIR